MCFTVATGANAWKTSIFSASVGLVEKATKPETEQRIRVKVGVCVCVCVLMSRYIEGTNFIPMEQEKRQIDLK